MCDVRCAMCDVLSAAPHLPHPLHPPYLPHPPMGFGLEMWLRAVSQAGP